MPGIMQSTALVLDYIKTFPLEEQKVSKDIYHNFETINMWTWVKLLVLMIAPTCGFGVVILMLDQPHWASLLVIIFIFSGFAHFLINNKLIEKLQEKVAEKIRLTLRNSEHARSGFERLRSQSSILGPDIYAISVKYNL